MRVWKAHASDKLGIITARERAAIEYREGLKARWKADAEVNKISRYVPCLHTPRPLSTLFTGAFVSSIDAYGSTLAGRATFRSRCTRLVNSSGRCSTQRASRRSVAASTRARAKASRRLSGRSLSSRSSRSVGYSVCCIVGLLGNGILWPFLWYRHTLNRVYSTAPD